MLLQFAKDGCPVDCGPAWTLDQLRAAVQRGNHPSARTPDAAACLWEEMLEKVKQGFAQIIPWSKLEKNPPNLKISPLAAVPHKSRPYQAILDLSYNLRIDNTVFASVNSSTRSRAHPKSMQQLSRVLPRVIYNVAMPPIEFGPIYMAKWDLKDGFWRLAVSQQDAWHFCHLLPSLPGEPPMVVIPTSLQMGWCNSLGLFCTATETACNVAQELLDDTSLALPTHPLEALCLPTSLITVSNTSAVVPKSLLRLLEVYVDDFIGLAQATSTDQLLHFTCAVLHGIHHIFPPALITNKCDDEPIALKKLLKGNGCWATTKEILGWTVDGVSRSISLPIEKYN